MTIFINKGTIVIATVGCPLLGMCADGVRPAGRPGRRNAPTERSQVTLRGRGVVGGWVEPIQVVSTVSEHDSESNCATLKAGGDV